MDKAMFTLEGYAHKVERMTVCMNPLDSNSYLPIGLYLQHRPTSRG